MSILSQGLQQRREKVDKTSLSYIFEEEPVDLTTFIKDSKYLNLPEIDLSPPQFQVIQAAERVLYADIYPKMGEEFGSEYWSADVPVKNLFTVMWGKGSSDPNTPIYDARTGLWTPLKDFKAGKVASSYHQDGKIFTADGTDSFKEGEGRMFVVTTKLGRKIRVWEGHRFLGWGRERYAKTNKKVVGFKASKEPKWKRLWDLNVGDHIAVATTIPEPLEPLEFSDRDVEMAGLLIGDGSTTKPYWASMTVGTQSPLTRARVKELYSMYENTGIKETLDESCGSKRYQIVPKNLGTVNHSTSFRKYGEDFDLVGKTARTKRVPEKLFRANNRQIALLVSRLIDTDGWVCISNTAEVGYGTISEGLAEDVVRLFLRLGVPARKERKVSKYLGENYVSYQVTIRHNESLRHLLPQLTLLDKEVKKEEVLYHLEHKVGTKTSLRHGDLFWDTIKSIEFDGVGEYWTLSVDGPASYVSSSGVFDHNSGKDAFARFTSLRIAHILLCMRNPQEYFKMPTMDSIHMLNVASNAPQAYRAFFKPMSDAVTRGWFRDKAHPTKGSIQYAKNLEAVSGHSDAEGQEGLNILLGVADEIDAFPVRTHGKNADGEREVSTSSDTILDMLRSSAATRFPETYKRIAISYPRYLGSPIMREIEKSKKSIKDNGNKTIHYLSGPLSTWEVNPRVSGPEHFAEHYAEDPNKAKAMYECKPQKASDPYFRNFEIFRAAINRESQPVTVDYQLETIHSKMVKNSTSQAWVPKYSFAPDFQPVQGAMYALHADLALVGDRAGIAMSHVEKWQEVVVKVAGEDGEVFTQTKYLPEIKVDFVIPLEADLLATPAREIQIRWARELAGILIDKGFLVKRFTFDNFQSADSMQLLEMQGIETDRVSADRTDAVWKNLRDVASEGRLKMPYDELLMDELESLTKIKGKVDHLPHKSKDLADALACSIVGAIAIGGEEDADGKMVDLGEKFFDVGQAETPLYGYDDFELSPIGMNQEEHYGYF